MRGLIPNSPFAIRKLLLFVASLSIALVALAVLVMARPSSFRHMRMNLSSEADLISAFPDTAVSPDDNWVVVVWTGERAEDVGARGHVYLRAASEAGGWKEKVTVFSGTQSAEAYETAVAVTDTDVHVAYIEFQRDGPQLTQTAVRYVVCSLPSGSCGSAQTIYSEDTGTPGYVVRQVDIALDDGGDPHVVWSKYLLDGTEGDIYYNTISEGSWGDEKWVDEDGDDMDARPAIAWDNGYAHVVWETKQNYIQYRRRDDAGAWSEIVSTLQDSRYPQRNPDITAGVGRVFAVWDWCGTQLVDPGDKCEEYNVAYKHITGTLGASLLDPREVGTDMGDDKINDWELYASTDDGQVLDEYRLYLQPAIALNDEGWPAVVWHADQGNQEYVVYYSYALTGTQDGVSWITPTVLSAGGTPGWAAATVGVGKSDLGGEQALHVAYMGQSGGEWEVYYDSDEAADYPHAYLPLVFRSY